LEVVGCPGDLRDIEDLGRQLRAPLEPAHQLELPTRLGEPSRRRGDLAEHCGRDMFRDHQLGARAEAAIRKHHHRGPTLKDGCDNSSTVRWLPRATWKTSGGSVADHGDRDPAPVGGYPMLP